MEPGISFLIPYFNKGSSIAGFFLSLEMISQQLQQDKIAHDFVVVNDGSDDFHTEHLHKAHDHLEASLKSKIKLVSRPNNLGKGATLHEASLHAKHSTCVWLDADLAFRETDILNVAVQAFQNTNAVVIANRRRSHSEGLSLYRKLTSKLFRRMAAFVLGLPVSDIQAGLKGMPTTWFRNHEWVNRRFGLDIEMLHRAHKMGLSLIQVPIDLVKYERNSTVRILRTSADLLLSLLRTLLKSH